MPTPVVPLDSHNERQHRTIIAQVTNELVKVRPPYDRTESEIDAGVTPLDYRYPPGDARRYGADPALSNDINRTAIQNALDSSPYVLIPEPYTIAAPVSLRSNQVIEFIANGGITLANGVTTQYMILGDTITNTRIINATLAGNGSAGISLVRLDDCTRVLFDHCRITKSGAMGIQLEGCSDITVFACELSQNYFYGVSDTDGARNHYIGNRCFENGDTGIDTSTGGRGINLWRCVDCVVDGNSFVASTEYGFRIYSESTDSASSYGNRVVNNYFEDNVKADCVLYDESLAGELVLRNIVANNIAIRSSNPTLDCSFLCHGGDNSFEDCHVYKNGSFGDFVAFAIYYGVRQLLKGCTAQNLRDAVSLTSTTDCTIDNFEGIGVATVTGTSGSTGTGDTIRDSKFRHGGAGGSDVAMPNYNSTGRNYYIGNLIDGFSVGIYIGTEAVTIRDNETVNSGSAGLRKDSDAQAGQVIIGNVWDSTNPALIQQLERRAAGNAVLYSNAAPTIRTWAVGDRTYNNAPSAGNPKSWVCTTAGTPGTWTSEGNL